jgi:hypothetical protein
VKLAFILTISVGLLCFKFAGTATAQESVWPCDVPGFKHLIGEPSSAIVGLELPANFRHIPGDEIPVRVDSSGLSIMHSGTLEEAETDPNSVIVGFICG